MPITTGCAALSRSLTARRYRARQAERPPARIRTGPTVRTRSVLMAFSAPCSRQRGPVPFAIANYPYSLRKEIDQSWQLRLQNVTHRDGSEYLSTTTRID